MERSQNTLNHCFVEILPCYQPQTEGTRTNYASTASAAKPERGTYAGRLVLGEHSIGVVVHVVFVGFMLRLTEAVDVLRRQESRQLDEHFGECETRHGGVPAEKSKKKKKKKRQRIKSMRDGGRTGRGGLLSKGVIHNMFDTNKHNNPQELQASLHRAS